MSLTPVIDTLIDKQDGFEIVREQIACILAIESANQITLATTAGKPNPDEWKLRVFEERANPWEQFLNFDDGDPLADLSPIVNVWYDGSNFDESKSNIVERQAADGTFNIDIYGYGQSASNGAGHDPGDEVAAKTAQRGVRLVRNILMAAANTYLQLRGFVWKRWPQSVTQFQPEQNNVAVQNIVGIRLAFSVTFNEFAPQVTPETLELLSVDIKRDSDGMLIAGADFDYTAP